jgi:RNA polymerase subunit RPABC4/transcription elongation factor Spt4
MRSCPNCHKEIQDEAVFCRFCRREVDPPLWLTSLQKCPFCAEWVERGIERCPLCGKDLSQATPFSIPVEKVEQATDLFARLRQSTQAADSFDDEEDEETQTE